MRRRPDVEVVLYTRARCGLCARAEAIVRAELGRRAHLRIVDIDVGDDDGALERRYGVRVPVVTVAGTEVAELELARGTVRRAISAARRSA